MTLLSALPKRVGHVDAHALFQPRQLVSQSNPVATRAGPTQSICEVRIKAAANLEKERTSRVEIPSPIAHILTSVQLCRSHHHVSYWPCMPIRICYMLSDKNAVDDSVYIYHLPQNLYSVLCRTTLLETIAHEPTIQHSQHFLHVYTA